MKNRRFESVARRGLVVPSPLLRSGLGILLLLSAFAMDKFASHDALGPGELAFNLGILPSVAASLLWAVAIFWRMAEDQGRFERVDVVIVRFIFLALLASTLLYLGTILYFSARAIGGLYVQMGI